MDLKNQLTNLEISKKLKELNCKQDSLFYWTKKINFDWAIAYKYWRPHANELVYMDEHSEMCPKEKLTRCIPAYTVAELEDLLPEGVHITIYDNLIRVGAGHIFSGTKVYGYDFEDKNGANARGKMLIYLLENNLITL